MKKRIKTSIILTAAAVLFLFLLAANCGSDKSAGNYNVVLIVADALRSDVLGCYGGDAHTPNLDRLARKGVLFENAYSTAPCTIPSAVGIFTGSYPGSYGVVEKGIREKSTHNVFYVNDNETLLGEALKEKGYDVLMDMENKLAWISNNVQGFSEFRRIKEMNKAGIAFVKETTGVRFIRWKNNLTPQYNRMFTFLHYLLTVPREQNFFVTKWFIDPHAPYSPIEAFKKKITFDISKLPREESFYSQQVGVFRQLARQKKLSDAEIVYLKALYKAEVESIDERVGYIIKALEHRGLLDKTIIVFTSDHGELFGEHGLMGHGYYYYEQLLQVPLIIAGPGIPAGKKEKTIISNLDLMPTLKDLLGIEYEHNMQGKSYSGLFSGKALPDRAQYFGRTTNLARETDISALLMEGHKLVVTKKKDNVILELFDCAGDPGELKNIAVENRPIVQKMLKKFMDLRKEIALRLKRNIAEIGDKVDFEKKWLITKI